MEEDLGKMFREKNKEIFINSLTLEIDRNLDALKSTTDNCVALEINKLVIFFKSFFKENDISYKKEELLGLLFREKTEINKIVNNRIEEKKVSIKENFLEGFHNEDALLSNFIDLYTDELKEETTKMNNDLDIALKTRICLEFSEYVIKKFKLTNEEQQERINSRINILFKDTVLRRIKEETEFRDESLRNQTIESFKKYRSLNENTYGKFAKE